MLFRNLPASVVTIDTVHGVKTTGLYQAGPGCPATNQLPFYGHRWINRISAGGAISNLRPADGVGTVTQDCAAEPGTAAVR